MIGSGSQRVTLVLLLRSLVFQTWRRFIPQHSKKDGSLLVETRISIALGIAPDPNLYRTQSCVRQD